MPALEDQTVGTNRCRRSKPSLQTASSRKLRSESCGMAVGAFIVVHSAISQRVPPVLSAAIPVMSWTMEGGVGIAAVVGIQYEIMLSKAIQLFPFVKSVFHRFDAFPFGALDAIAPKCKKVADIDRIPPPGGIAPDLVG